MGTKGRDCRALLTRIFGYLDGELTPEDCRALEAHLAQCHCCQPFADSLRRTMVACRVAGAPPLPRDVQARARARVRALLKGAAPQSPRAGAARKTAPKATSTSRARRPARPSP